MCRCIYSKQINSKIALVTHLSRETIGANYIHFPAWLGEWFFDELTYEERGQDGKWRKPGKGNNEAFDLFCYAHAIRYFARL